MILMTPVHNERLNISRLYSSPVTSLLFIITCENEAIRFSLSSPSLKKTLPSWGFEPGSPRPRSKLFDDLDRSAMGPAHIPFFHYFGNIIMTLLAIQQVKNNCLHFTVKESKLQFSHKKAIFLAKIFILLLKMLLPDLKFWWPMIMKCVCLEILVKV